MTLSNLLICEIEILVSTLVDVLGLNETTGCKVSGSNTRDL